MTEPKPLLPIIDATNGFINNDGWCEPRDRDIDIHIRVSGGGFEILAFGPGMRTPGSNYALGHPHLDPDALREAATALHRTWQTEISGYTVGRPRGKVQAPFADLVDLRRAPDPARVDELWRTLAKAGYLLYRQLFEQGDPGLRKLGARLRHALWSGQQTITVFSDDAVVPWSMLYTPRDPDAMFTEDFTVDLEGFWGYGHLVEHKFRIEDPPIADIPVNGRVAAGGYVDARLDRRLPLTVQPVIDFLNRRTDLVVARQKAETEARFWRAGRHDQLIYFCCHSFEERGFPILKLSDGHGIGASDVRGWIGRRGLRRRPLAFINACDAALLPSSSLSHFGTALLDGGASSLVGPSVQMPRRFARVFGTALLCRILRPGAGLGPVVHDLTRMFAKTHRNPLGLAYSLYHGIDSHFCTLAGAAEADDDHK